jgi:hypothetical protein
MKRIAKLPPPPKPAQDPVLQEFDDTVTNAKKNKQKQPRRPPANPPAMPSPQRRRSPLDEPTPLPDDLT